MHGIFSHLLFLCKSGGAFRAGFFVSARNPVENFTGWPAGSTV
jgi:hypothetical protein